LIPETFDGGFQPRSSSRQDPTVVADRDAARRQQWTHAAAVGLAPAIHARQKPPLSESPAGICRVIAQPPGLFKGPGPLPRPSQLARNRQGRDQLFRGGLGGTIREPALKAMFWSGLSAPDGPLRQVSQSRSGFRHRAALRRCLIIFWTRRRVNTRDLRVPHTYRFFAGAFALLPPLVSRQAWTLTRWRFAECAAGAFVRRTPGRSPLVNSTPAASRARCSASTVRSFSASPLSNLATVSTDTFAAAASSRTPQPRAERAIRHWTGKKIITAR
jgi:hypothetical protein